MELYLIRHGQSEANALRVYSGWASYGLTPLGEAQARRTAELVRGVGIDRIIASDLLRARQTAALVFPGRPVQLCADLRELNLTRLAGQDVAAVKARLSRLYPGDRDFDYAALGCESCAGLMARVGRFLEGLDKRSPERVAVVTHNGVLRAVAAHVLGVSWTAVELKNDNCAVSVLASEGGRWTIRRWNGTGAL